MKSTHSIYPSLLKVTAALAIVVGPLHASATGTTPAPGPTISETESNNTISTANAVSTTGTTVNGTMSTSTDTDYFVVQLPAGKTLTATMTPGSSTADYDLYIYNSAGTQLAYSENSAGAVDKASVSNTTTATSARYVRVKYYSGGTGSTSGKYTLKLDW